MISSYRYFFVSCLSSFRSFLCPLNFFHFPFLSPFLPDWFILYLLHTFIPFSCIPFIWPSYVHFTHHSSLPFGILTSFPLKHSDVEEQQCRKYVVVRGRYLNVFFGVHAHINRTPGSVEIGEPPLTTVRETLVHRMNIARPLFHWLGLALSNGPNSEGRFHLKTGADQAPEMQCSVYRYRA